MPTIAPPRRKTVSLIVPAYKQQQSIVNNLKQLLKVLANIRYDYEVIVVVDGNADKTAQTIKQANLVFSFPGLIQEHTYCVPRFVLFLLY